MKNLDKNMSEIFDIDPISDMMNDDPDVKKVVLPAPMSTGEPNLKQDLNDAYATSKDNLVDFIEQGKDAMEELLQIAKAGQHPRAFEVFATLFKNMTDANDKLLDMQKKMREMDGKKAPVGDTIIDKAVFVGSTSELNKMIKNKE
jgi:hypothetical protein